METGDVVVWHNFPTPRHGEIKDRWFICLGRTDILCDPILFHMCTSTTKISEEDFQSGRIRGNHKYVYYSKETSPFKEDCIVDVNERPYAKSENEILSCKDIEIKGKLTKDQLRQLYNKLKDSPVYSLKILLDIHRCLSNIGLKDIRKPR